MKIDSTWTTEDISIMHSSACENGHAKTLASMLEGDSRDAAAMNAVSVLDETLNRVHGLAPYSAARRVQIYGDTGLREEMEEIAAEPLA